MSAPRIDCTLFDNVAMTADFYSQWIDTRGMTELTFHLTNVATGSPVGVWKVEVTNDPLVAKEKAKEPIVTGASSAAKLIDISSSISPLYGTGLTVSGANNTFFALTGGLPRFVRIWFDYSSGGSASSLCSGWTSGRE